MPPMMRQGLPPRAEAVPEPWEDTTAGMDVPVASDLRRAFPGAKRER